MDINSPAPLSLETLILNLVLGLILSLIVSWYYVRFGKSLSNRARFARILPLLTLITLLVISIVKSSLALSLGLVGALSIVRFRTAIKDPEELIFLFFAIAIGLGMGADQRIPTLCAVLVIMVYLLIKNPITKVFTKKENHSLYLNIATKREESGSQQFSRISKLLTETFSEVDLRRLDNANEQIQMTYYVFIEDQQKLVEVMDRLSLEFPECNFSIIEQNNLVGG